MEWRIQEAKVLKRKTHRAWRPALSARPFALCVLLLAACQQQMADQPRYDPLAKSDFFDDGRSARPAVEGSVARGRLEAGEHLYTGKTGGKPAEAIPFAVTRNVLARGRERYDIYCSPCHDRLGNGRGMVVRRGFRAPPSFHNERLRQAPAGHFFDVMSHGLGDMPDYAEQISAEDRWAVAAYIRALQLSQRAPLAQLPEEERRKLLEMKP